MGYTMVMSLVSIAAYSLFILLIHRGGYPPALSAPRKARREYIEVGILTGCLLAVPYIKFDLLLFSGWPSAYFTLGILAPLVMETIVQRRPLSTIGFRIPKNNLVMAITAVIVGLYMVSGFAKPLVLGVNYNLGLSYVLSNVIIFPFLEEVFFRGLIQTRLESALGGVRSWILSGLLFGFSHYYINYMVSGREMTATNVVQVASLTVFGMLLGVVFTKTRSLLPSFLVHCVNNLFAASRL